MVRVLINRPTRSNTMTLITGGGARLSMRSTPTNFEYSEVPRFGQIEREGAKTLTRQVAPGLRTLSFTHTVASLDRAASIEATINKFRIIARDGHRVRFTGGSVSFEEGRWYVIKNLAVTAVQRGYNQNVSHASLEWELEEHVDVTTNIIRPKPTVKKAATKVKARTGGVRSHRVKKGDTLWAIARKYLGNGARYPEIVRLNKSKIKNPHWIYPNQVFKIPAK